MSSAVRLINSVKLTKCLLQGAFNKEVIETMSRINARPIIFPLSNPVRLSECQFHEAVEWSEGRVVFASGSPFAPLKYNGNDYYPGQGNNMYIFPGQFYLTIALFHKLTESP